MERLRLLLLSMLASTYTHWMQKAYSLKGSSLGLLHPNSMYKNVGSSRQGEIATQIKTPSHKKETLQCSCDLCG